MSLTRDVATLAEELSAQLAEARTQLTGLSSALINLQASVDRLHAEIQRLFAQGARNDLDTIVNTVARRRRPDAPASSRIPAGALYTDATRIALTETVLNPTDAFDALTAGMRGDLDPNVNFFALFPGQRHRFAREHRLAARARVDRAPAAARAAGCACRRPTSGPPPRARMRSCCWRTATSSRATASTSSTRCWPAGMRSSARSTGSRPVTPTPVPTAGCSTPRSTTTARGSATTPNRQSGPPALIQALRAERERYLANVRPTNVKPTSTAPWIDPYGRVSSAARRRRSLRHAVVPRPPFRQRPVHDPESARNAPAGHLAAGRGPQRSPPRRRRRQSHVERELGRRIPQRETRRTR